MHGGINPASSDIVSAQLAADVENGNINRQPPPPYTAYSSDAVITNQPTIHQTIVHPKLKEEPVFYNCPNCNDRVLTRVNYVNTQKTHLVAGFVCGLTFWCCLCCLAAIPYLITTCKRTEHFCPRCTSLLGHYSKI